MKQIASMMCSSEPEIHLNIVPVQQQTNSVDCGVFAVAFATSLAFGEDPAQRKYDTSAMQPHLLNCLRKNSFSPFPLAEKASKRCNFAKGKRIMMELFCSCRMPYEAPKSKKDYMARCDICHECYHQSCEKISMKIFNKRGTDFICNECAKKTR